MTPDEKKDLTYFLSQYPDYRVQYGPVVAKIGEHPYTSMGVSVWIWKEDDVAGTARMFSGETLGEALGQAIAELGGGGLGDLDQYYKNQIR